MVLPRSNTSKRCKQSGNSVDPVQIYPSGALHCLPRPVCPKPLGHEGRLILEGADIGSLWSYMMEETKLPG